MKKLQHPITEEMVHTVALLTAVGMPLTSIKRISGTTDAAVARIKADPTWPTLVEAKKAALTALMRGDA